MMVHDQKIARDRVQDPRPVEERLRDSQSSQPAPHNPHPTIASVTDILSRYEFINAAKMFKLFQTFQDLLPIAVVSFSKITKQITPAKMRFHTRGRETFLSDTFHSIINKYATKRIHFHKPRLAACAMDWNKNIGRAPDRILQRRQQHTNVRNRIATSCILP
ncbi:hypothetical protein R1sor_015847 [Riccia sorocarpa]|uniref:Uncharacterized protein n=1 Tax=Riccia sorocarpa TaxID=122646 RepID=A0ABD3HDC8_9MARC